MTFLEASWAYREAWRAEPGNPAADLAGLLSDDDCMSLSMLPGTGAQVVRISLPALARRTELTLGSLSSMPSAFAPGQAPPGNAFGPPSGGQAPPFMVDTLQHLGAGPGRQHLSAGRDQFMMQQVPSSGQQQQQQLSLIHI